MAKTWVNTVQNSYASQDELESYDEMYNLCFRAGYTGENRVKQMWDDNKVIGGSVNPEDFGLASIEEIANILLPEYKGAIEFTESNMNDLPGVGEFDYAEETIEKMKSDLVKFIDSIGMDKLQSLINHATGSIFTSLFPHDFWLTRNGHGSGFWDSPEWNEDDGKFLTLKSREAKESDAYLGDDGLVYLS